MNRFPRACAALVIAALAVLGLQAAPVSAATDPQGALRSVGTLNKAVHAQYNEYGGGDSWNWADSDIVATFKASNGVGVARYLSSDGPKLVVDVYDPATRAQVGTTQTVALNASFPIWGGFYAGSDGHFYVLTGGENPQQSLTQSTMIVQRFSPTWADEGTATIAGRGGSGKEGIYVPFDAAAADMTLVGSRLVVHTGRTMFGDKVHHQADFAFEVDTSTMKATPFSDLGDPPYSSHSFNQLVTTWQDDLVFIDHGDAYPRAIQMTVMAGYPTKRVAKSYDLKKLPGAIGDNTTGTSITGLASGPSGVLVVGNAVRLSGSKVDNDEARNVFVIAANPATGKTSISQLTKFAPDGDSFAYEPRIAKVGTDRFAVIFMTEDAKGFSTQYRLLDSSGKLLASKTFAGMAHASIDDPTLVGSQLFWVSTTPGSGAQAYLFGLDVANPAAPTVVGAPVLSTIIAGKPVISGRTQAGSTLTARVGTWSPSDLTYRYQWYQDGKRISGATAKTFRLTSKHVGHRLSVHVSGSKAGYATANAGSSRTAVVRK